MDDISNYNWGHQIRYWGGGKGELRKIPLFFLNISLRFHTSTKNFFIIISMTVSYINNQLFFIISLTVSYTINNFFNITVSYIDNLFFNISMTVSVNDGKFENIFIYFIFVCGGNQSWFVLFALNLLYSSLSYLSFILFVRLFFLII